MGYIVPFLDSRHKHPYDTTQSIQQNAQNEVKQMKIYNTEKLK